MRNNTIYVKFWYDNAKHFYLHFESTILDFFWKTFSLLSAFPDFFDSSSIIKFNIFYYKFNEYAAVCTYRNFILKMFFSKKIHEISRIFQLFFWQLNKARRGASFEWSLSPLPCRTQISTIWPPKKLTHPTLNANNLDRFERITSIIDEYNDKSYSDQCSELITTLTAIGSI